MRIQFVPFPAMNPFIPSSLHILAKAFPIDIWYASRPALWTWNKIFNRSRGDTTVRETAPAIPPAQNEAITGCEMKDLNWYVLEGGPLSAMADGVGICQAMSCYSS
jgi:hypothetical protein